MAASWNLKDDFPFFLSLLFYLFMYFFFLNSLFHQYFSILIFHPHSPSLGIRFVIYKHFLEDLVIRTRLLPRHTKKKWKFDQVIRVKLFVPLEHFYLPSFLINYNITIFPFNNIYYNLRLRFYTLLLDRIVEQFWAQSCVWPFLQKVFAVHLSVLSLLANFSWSLRLARKRNKKCFDLIPSFNL